MEINVNLWDYQQEAIDNMFGENGIYTNGGKLAEVILPTGAGKSFIALQSIIEVMKINDREEIEKNNVITKTPITYFAPNNLILYQFRKHVAKLIMKQVYFYLEVPNSDFVENSDVEPISNNILRKFGINYGDAAKLNPEEEPNPYNPIEAIMKTIDKSIENLSAAELKKLVDKSFPNFKLRCYQSIKSDENPEEFVEEQVVGEDSELVEKIDDELYIIDEAHRGASAGWGEKLKKLILSNIKKKISKTKFLGITATPVRSSDDADLFRECAIKAKQERYIAQEIYVLDAMDKEIIVTPQVQYFPCLLDETREYLDVMKKYLKAKKEEFKKPQNTSSNVYRVILEEMHKTMGISLDISKELLTFSRTDIENLGEIDEIKSINEFKNRDRWEFEKKKIVQETIHNIEGGVKGKSIAFIPAATTTESAEQVIENSKQKLYDLFGGKEAFDLLEPYHSMTSSTNDETLKKFESPKNPSLITAILTNKMADEGFHPEGIKNLFFLDRISADDGAKKKKATNEVTPKLRFFQKIGRGIFGIKGKKEGAYEIPIIFDFANNFGRHMESLITEDGKNILKIPSNIQYFFELANIPNRNWKYCHKLLDPQTHDVIGYRFDPTGKNNQPHEFKIRDCSDPDNTDVIIEIQKPSEKYDPLKENDKFKLLLTALEELKELGITYDDINKDTIIDKEFFESKNIENELVEKYYENMTLKDFAGMNDKKYHIGEALEIFRKAFWREVDASSKACKVFAEYSDYEKLVELGIINIDLENIPQNLKFKVRQDGFIMVHGDLPESAIGINVKTGTKFDEKGKDEFGCYIDGKDDLGYDRYGFDQYGIHKKTKCKYDDRYFFRDENGNWKNVFTGTELDVFGYNHEGINPETGFDRGNFDEVPSRLKGFTHFWHKNINGVFSRIKKVYAEDEKGKKLHDFYWFGSDPSGKIAEGAPYWLNVGSIEREGFLRGRKHKSGDYFVYDRIADRDLDIDRVDLNGFQFPQSGYKKGETKIYNVYTSSPYDITGKDYLGQYPAEFILTIGILNKISEGNSSKEIENYFDNEKIKEFLLKNKISNIDKAIVNGFFHFFKYKDFMTDDKCQGIDICSVFNKIETNENMLEVLEKISPSIKEHYCSIALSQRIGYERLREKNIELKMGRISNEKIVGEKE